MPKKKKLRDASIPHGARVSQNRETIKSFVAKHGVCKTFNLQEALEEAARDYLMLDSMQQRELLHAEKKEYLEEVNKRAIALEECLRKMGAQTRSEIAGAWGNLSGKERWKSRIEGDVHRLALASRRALLRLPKHKGGKPLDEAFHRLIDRLLDIYRESTGKPLRLSRGSSEHHANFQGPFFRFVFDCLTLMGIKKSNIALGRELQRRLKTKTR